MMSFSSIWPFVVTFGPWIIPKVIAFIRSVRSGKNAPIRPVTPKARRAINILTFSFALFLVASFPNFAPENIFRSTQSRLIIPTDVLFTRLGQLRPLSPLDEALKAKFVSLESRLLYFRFGPDVLATCPFCSSDDPLSYFYYALPMLLAPHILHLIIIGLATSSLVSGSHASRWRNYAVIASLVFLATDLYLVGAYDHADNKTATTLGALDFFFWRMRTLRYVAFMVIDAALGLVIWASSTNRAFVKPIAAVERQEESIRILEAMSSTLVALGIVRNTNFGDMGDNGLFRRTANYWEAEARARNDAFSQPEVVQALHNANSRINVEEVAQHARILADSILGSTPNLRATVSVSRPPGE